MSRSCSRSSRRSNRHGRCSGAVVVTVVATVAEVDVASGGEGVCMLGPRRYGGLGVLIVLSKAHLVKMRVCRVGFSPRGRTVHRVG